MFFSAAVSRVQESSRYPDVLLFTVAPIDPTEKPDRVFIDCLTCKRDVCETQAKKIPLGPLFGVGGEQRNTSSKGIFMFCGFVYGALAYS